MKAERIFNIFVYFDAGISVEYGVYFHEIEGEDDDKIAFLLSHVDDDHVRASRFKMVRGFTPEEWRATFRLGNVIQYFEEAFKFFDASVAPLYCITSIVEGKVAVDHQIGPEHFRGDIVSHVEGRGAVPDYLVHYVSGNTFHFTKLIHDDYFQAIKVLYGAQLYVSSAKLLMSCVDTLAFVEYGDEPGNFAGWLNSYVDLSGIDVTPEELWEFRNSILHMTNLASRKVVSGKISPIMPYIGRPDTMPRLSPDHPKPFNLFNLIQAIGDGIGRWGASYNSNPEKLIKFIERYDKTISDSRVAYFRHETRQDRD